MVDKEMQDENRNISYSEYMRKHDSIQHEFITNGRYVGPGSGWGIFSLRAVKYDEKVGDQRYYLALGGYEATDDVLSYRKNGKNYMDYTVWDTVTEYSKTGHDTTVAT